MKRIRKFIACYKHGFVAVAFFPVYLIWFFYLEQNVTRYYQVIHVPLDDYIPFCEIFIIPYYLWFAYVAFALLLVFFTDKTQYYNACAFLFTGMTVFLIVSTLWPNGQHLRPFTMPRDNIFTQMVEGLYRTDTPTNIWPSIHVFNSIGAHLAIRNCRILKDRKGIRLASVILAISIIVSTVFLKQHSVFDMLTAFVMALILYYAVYRKESLIRISQMLRAKKTLHEKQIAS